MAVSVQTHCSSALSMWHLSQPSPVFASDFDTTSQSVEYYSPAALEPSSVIPMYHHQTRVDGESKEVEPLPLLGKFQSTTPGSKVTKLERSSSTPNVRGQATVEAAALALSADKRRNKLGYHRTSVACGHCRRRKIRCIPAPGDHQNRCSNCIRLKKECNFYPVDQQNLPEPKRRASKTQGTATGDSSRASSPSVKHAQVFDNITLAHEQQNQNIGFVPGLGGPATKRQRTESMSPELKVAAIPRNQDFSQAPRTWLPSEVSPDTKDNFEGSQRLWKDASNNHFHSSFAPYSSVAIAMPLSDWSTTHSGQVAKSELEWSIPPRSSSYSNLERLHDNQYGTYGPSHSSSNQYSAKPRVIHSTYSPGASSSMADTSSSKAIEPVQPLTEESSSAGTVPLYPSWQPHYSYAGAAPPNQAAYHAWAFPPVTHLPPPATIGHSGQHSGQHQYSYDEQQGTPYFSDQGHTT